MYQNLIISRGKSAIYMWCTILLIVAQAFFVIVCRQEGVVFMVSIYTAVTILWLSVWQFFAGREIGLRLWDVMKDVSPYLLVSAVVMAVTFYVTLWIKPLVLLLLARLVVAALLYLSVMKVSGSRIQKDCIGYFLCRKN